jgi:hypothetical protein
MESPLIPPDAITKAFSAPPSSDRQPGGYIGDGYTGQKIYNRGPAYEYESSDNNEKGPTNSRDKWEWEKWGTENRDYKQEVSGNHSVSQPSEKEEEDLSDAIFSPEDNTTTFDPYAGMSKGQRKRARRRERKLVEQNRWTAPSSSHSTTTTPSSRKYVDGVDKILEQDYKVKSAKLLNTVGVLATVGAAAWVVAQRMLG